MVKAFERLPSLRVISTPAESAYEWYIAKIKELLPTYCFINKEAYEVLLSVNAMRCVLLVAGLAGLRLSNLHCQQFNCRALRKGVRDLPTLRRSLLHLKVLEVAFAGSRYVSRESRYGRILDIWKSTENDSLTSFITSAPYLERLGLYFDTCISGFSFLSLKNIANDFHWLSLKAISLACLASSEQYLVHFLERHKHTLREISLRDMTILFPDLWYITFHEVRRVFGLGHQLGACKLRGTFRDHNLIYEMETKREGNVNTNGTMISDYIRATDVGDITLIDYCQMKTPK